MKKKSALLVSISMVLVAVLALTTASFAWFTAGTKVAVSGFDVQVVTADALLVGTNKDATVTATSTYETDVKKIAFKSSLDPVDLTGGYIGVGATKIKNELLAGNRTVGATADLAPVLGDITPADISANKKIETNKTTANTLAFKRLTDYTKEPVFPSEAYEDAKNAIPTTLPDKNVDTVNKTLRMDYVQFDLYFKASFSKSTSVKVFLDLTTNDGTYAGSDFYPLKKEGQNWVPMVIGDAATDKSYWITAAMRAGFVATEVQKADGAFVETPATNELKILEIDSSAPTDIKNTKIDPAKAYDCDKTCRIGSTPDAGGAITRPAVDATGKNDLELFTISNNAVYRLSVYMWIEGNDTQCLNTISSGKFKSNFKFKGIAV